MKIAYWHSPDSPVNSGGIGLGKPLDRQAANQREAAAVLQHAQHSRHILRHTRHLEVTAQVNHSILKFVRVNAL